MNKLAVIDSDITRTVDVLGGGAALKRRVQNRFDLHDVLSAGLPVDALVRMGAVVSEVLDAGAIDRVLGTSLRTLQRHKKSDTPKLLSAEQSGRVWQFAEILGRARAVFGSDAAAEAWLKTPLASLDHRKPIDLLSTPVGAAEVGDYLTRVEYGVYA